MLCWENSEYYPVQNKIFRLYPMGQPQVTEIEKKNSGD